MINEIRNLEFISLHDFLMLPFINPYSECIVYDLDTENVLIGESTIKNLIADINAGMDEELQEEYYVSDLIPGIRRDENRLYYGLYYIYLRRF